MSTPDPVSSKLGELREAYRNTPRSGLYTVGLRMEDYHALLDVAEAAIEHINQPDSLESRQRIRAALARLVKP